MEKDLLTALGFFKDWSNFMLVTTVAALGWTAKIEDPSGNRWLRLASVACFAASIVFAVFTLALVPLVGEQIANGARSMYAVEAEFNVLWTIDSPWTLKLKHVCWPQHVMFILGIAFYAAWSFTRTDEPPQRTFDKDAAAASAARKARPGARPG